MTSTITATSTAFNQDDALLAAISEHDRQMWDGAAAIAGDDAKALLFAIEGYADHPMVPAFRATYGNLVQARYDMAALIADDALPIFPATGTDEEKAAAFN